jgi:NAD(P)-dependent dehydrogenase (short-subunit alcohol dehydrogenase family)
LISSARNDCPLRKNRNAPARHASGGEPGRVDRVKQFVPLRRAGTPDEVAQAILWLLSPEASFTTGSFIEVAGGR